MLDGFQGNYAWINDPARGEVKVTMEEFGRSFTGICLQIKPGPDFEPGGKPKSTVEFARRRLRGAGAAVAFVLFSTVIGYLFGIINPLFSRFFMDRLLTGENRELLMPFLVLLALMGGAQVITSWVQAVYNMKLNGKMAIVGSSDFMWKILRLPMEFFSQRMGGDILQRQGTNASIASTLVNTLTPLALNTIMMIFYLVVMVRYSVLLSILGIFTIILNLLVSRIISAKREVGRISGIGQYAECEIRQDQSVPGHDSDTSFGRCGVICSDSGRVAYHVREFHPWYDYDVPAVSQFVHVSGYDFDFGRADDPGNAHTDGACGRCYAIPGGS